MYKSHLVNVKELKVTQHPEQRRKKREGTKVVSIFSNNRLFYITEKIYNWEDSKLRSFEFSILLFSWITKGFEFISSQNTCHLVGLNELGKNQKFTLNLLNQLTTKSWEWHPQQNLGNDTQNSKEKRRERRRLSRFYFFLHHKGIRVYLKSVQWAKREANTKPWFPLQ